MDPCVVEKRRCHCLPKVLAFLKKVPRSLSWRCMRTVNDLRKAFTPQHFHGDSQPNVGRDFYHSGCFRMSHQGVLEPLLHKLVRYQGFGRMLCSFR